MDDHDEPRWLEADEQEAWLGLIGVVINLPAALDRQLRRDAGMSHFDYQVLAGLSTAPDHTLRMSDLADWTEGSLPRLSQVVSRLERAGWVRRSPDPSDGRYTLATLLEEGLEALEAAAPGHVAAVRRYVFDALTAAQVRQLAAITGRIGAAIDRGEGRPGS